MHLREFSDHVIAGMWQLSGAHGYKPNLDASLVDMKSLIDAGFVSFDLADHYGQCNAARPFPPGKLMVFH